MVGMNGLLSETVLRTQGDRVQEEQKQGACVIEAYPKPQLEMFVEPVVRPA
jgi:hypothetical protein